VVTFIDEGEGFDPGGVPSPVNADNILKESGRGIYIMREIMDAVEFELPKSGGTRLRMTRRFEPQTCGRILCLDYGEKRIGLALSDELAITAQPLGKIEAATDERRLEEIRKVVAENEVSEVVVGLPLTLKGDVSHAGARVRAFARDLNHHLCLPVVTWDERLSTRQGEQILIDAGMSRKKRKGVVDSVAAAIILQSYLDARRNK
jgi:putative Holliday junction resolvase